MPDEDRHKIGHIMGGTQHRNRSMEDLQELDLLHMRHHRQGRDGNSDTQGKRTNHHFFWHVEGRAELDRPDSEANYVENQTISDEQQDRDIDAAELHLESHDMVSPRRKTDRHFIISAVRANDPDRPQ
eukprot:15389583-Heterocapsa_arctica.AAC.1